jgi:hypothetical protein
MIQQVGLNILSMMVYIQEKDIVFKELWIMLMAIPKFIISRSLPNDKPLASSKCSLIKILNIIYFLLLVLICKYW